MQQAPPVEEWTVKEWEVAYTQKCRELEKLKDHMRIAMQNLMKAVQMELELKTKSWENLFKVIRQSEIKSEGNFWAAVQHLEVQLEEKKQMAEDIENTQEQTHEQKSSVKVSKNSRGYNWEVKVYDDDTDKALEKMIAIELKCQEKYGVPISGVQMMGSIKIEIEIQDAESGSASIPKLISDIQVMEKNYAVSRWKLEGQDRIITGQKGRFKEQLKIPGILVKFNY